MRTLYQDTRKIIDDVAFSWIGPIFFVNLGTEIVFEADINVSVPLTIRFWRPYFSGEKPLPAYFR